MSSNNEKEAKLAEFFLKSFEEKSPLDYDILDSMFNDLQERQITKNNS